MAKANRNPVQLISQVNNDMENALHARRPRIAEQQAHEPSLSRTVVEQTAPALAPTTLRPRVPPSRVNLISVSSWITKESHKALNYLRVEEESTQQDLIQEAIDDLLVKKGALKLMKRPTVE
jgi:hypothetical protein